MITKPIKFMMALLVSTAAITSCDNDLNEPVENVVPLEGIDYTDASGMFPLLTGAYSTFNELQWETFPTIAVRGDDVNAAGDQVPLTQTDLFNYDRSFWMYNSTWLNLYTDILYYIATIEELEKFKAQAGNPALADQYIAEIRVLRGFTYLQLTRLWGGLLIPTSSAAEDLYTAPVQTRDEVLQYISDDIDEALPSLVDLRPNQRTDIPGGVTRYTGLAVKAMANLELQSWQTVADATGEIINSGLFSLYPDYYELFKLPGELSNESLLELQYSDLGQGSGQSFTYLNDFFGPNDYDPAVDGKNGGWGFWEPSVKFIKFMIDRNETVRLETSVLFTNEGIGIIESDPNYSDLPGFISNTTRDGDVVGKTDGSTNARAKFSSGKHYLPSNQITDGRTAWGGETKNFLVIRYAEVLLMHAEALTQGATSSVMTAAEAVNEVRGRAELGDLAAVTIDDVLDEKFAEFAMEWGIRFYDLVRHDRTEELDYDGRNYEEGEDRFLPYPLEQVDLLPQLGEFEN